jgi:hypothetical protein
MLPKPLDYRAGRRDASQNLCEKFCCNRSHAALIVERKARRMKPLSEEPFSATILCDQVRSHEGIRQEDAHHHDNTNAGDARNAGSKGRAPEPSDHDPSDGKHSRPGGSSTTKKVSAL